eukprot:CAMPEP_0119038058 /NCGR_PEP_ID=MMETSP1177-20130426/6740_1 /TAXON_ID=2985 /ORGANISM="Ochromonas sp, Strain CCMP1899" /LENGTH=529 /DNA_ID=CAMNT_0007000133 /DNA_START=135 /DNA_END=1721 /DNA_ORIENTATION=+
MGASASVRMLYKDSLSWFHQYFDTETYMDAFKSIDKHNENMLSFTDVKDWIVANGQFDSNWKIFLTSGPVLTIAHKYACKHGDDNSSVSGSKMVNVTEFKTLLVHLFALSILWSHFQNAEKWEDSGSEHAGHRLNFEAFKLACRTFDSANAHEDLTDAQIKTDFELIDSNLSGSVGFIEVCNHCYTFRDDSEVEKKNHFIAIPKFFGDIKPGFASDLQQELLAGPKLYYESANLKEKNRVMMDAFRIKLNAQMDNLLSAAALEHQNNIRKKYADIDAIINHPICCGYLLHFCNIQFCAENLNFVCEVHRFQDLFAIDTDIWTSNWKDTDDLLKIDDETANESLLTNSIWPSTVDKKVAVRKINTILRKFINSDAVSEVCISEDFLRKMKNRIKFLHLYGPAIFDEALIDPILTMHRDLLPRFEVSDTVNKMVMRVASCEPPPHAPSALELTPPHPENLLFNISTIDSFPDTRRFSLDQVIGCGDLYIAFLEFLTKGNLRTDRLHCIRKIDIYVELMTMQCEKEATEQAW